MAMSTHAHEIHHSIDYIEISVTDMPAAQRFYGQTVGWQFTPYGESYAGIRTAAEAEGEAGGLTLASPERIVRGGPFVILYSEDLEATLEAVRAAGGTIVDGPYDFPGGRRFHFLDPSGNELGVWSKA